MSAEFTVRRRLGDLSVLHWFVIGGSLLLILFASSFASAEIEKELEAQFAFDSAQTIDLVQDRMEQYEVGLWAGVGLIDALGAERPLRRADWVDFAGSLDLVNRYPGINGIGVIYYVPETRIDDYLSRFSDQYPELDDFGIKPDTPGPDHFPITFIEPFESNDEAVGLDMAFETNRYRGALAARATGSAQITGPIVLVQDDGQTPGFLFFAPFVVEGEDRFDGMVYAPFVVQRLMAGVLDAERRNVAISISDVGNVIYDEHHGGFDGHDPDPMFADTVDVEMYGRVWTFDVRSTIAFRDLAAGNEPAVILIVGLLVDAMLIFLFTTTTRSKKQALAYADQVTGDLRDTLDKLETTNASLARSNRDLERFAYAASHDLQTPIRTVSNYATLLSEELGSKLTEAESGHLRSLVRASQRMSEMVRSVLDYSRIGHDEAPRWVDLREPVQIAIDDLAADIESAAAFVHVGDLPTVYGRPDSLVVLFRNLIGNALKYKRKGRPPVIRLSAERDGQVWLIRCADNGIGIEDEYRDRVFEIFTRLNPKGKYDGAGIGLALCKRVVEAHDGTIDVTDNDQGGSTFTIRLPQGSPEGARAPSAGVTVS